MLTSKKEKYTTKKKKLCSESAFFFSIQDKDSTGTDDDVS